MRKIWLALAALLVAAGATLAYLMLAGTELTITLTQAEIEAKLAEKLPMTRKHLLLFEVTYSNPRLVLAQGDDRLRFAIDAELNNIVGQEGRRLRGTAEVTGGLRYDAERYEFYLTEPKVERIDVEGVPPALAAKVEPALQTMAQEMLERLPIYKLKPTDIKKATARAVLKRVTIEDGKVIVVLGL